MSGEMTSGGPNQSKLPNLPGYNVSFPPPVEGPPCEKIQTLYWRNGYAVVVPNPPRRAVQGSHLSTFGQSPKSAPQSATLNRSSPPPRPSATSNTSPPPSTLPGWLKHAGDVLRFSAYFIEELPEGHGPAEPWRVRHVQILHYLEDGTTQVVEPRIAAPDQQGIKPGILVKRAKIPLSSTSSEPPSKMEVFDPEAPFPALGTRHFIVGGTLTINGREITIVDADAFTRSYMAEAGVPLAAAVDVPISPYEDYVAKKSKPSGLSPSDPQNPTRFAEILMGKAPGTKKLQQFLEGNSKVLRFFAIWDDVAGALPGSKPVRRPYKIMYYLEDNTVEIVELKQGNGGREFYRFLARGMLPKRRGSLLLGSTLTQDDCVSPADLRIGDTLEVHGRAFFIHDADQFTKQWCIENLGWSKEEATAADVSEAKVILPKAEMPPYNGYGDPEDSAYNCTRLIPAPPKPQRKHLSADTLTVNCPALRFAAKLVPRPDRPLLSKLDSARRFVVSFFLEDGTIAVYEPAVPNSGITGGKFLERCKVFKAGTSERVKEEDLWVGAVVDLHGRLFELLDADEWTLQTMEREKELFPKADGQAAVQVLIRQVEHRDKLDSLLGQAGRGEISRDDFCSGLKEVIPEMAKQQAIAALRWLQQQQQQSFTASTKITY